MTALEVLVSVLAVGLATWQAVEVWHHGELFADVRDGLGGTADGDWQAAGLLGRLVMTASHLLLCPWCLSVWVSIFLTLLYASGIWWLQCPVVALAASRAANLGNDLAYNRCRTPRADRQLPQLPPE